jgi:multidrug efflux pump subunit AcrA (membrane-fusion protein)
MKFKKLKEKICLTYLNHRKLILYISGGFVLLLIIVTVTSVLTSRNTANTQIGYVAVSHGNITESIDIVGSLKALPSATLLWESSGIVNTYNLSIGDKVSKDDILMNLEESSVSSTVLQAYSDLLDAQMELDNLIQANINLPEAAQAVADAEYALRQKRTNRNYWNIKGASDDAIEQARTAYYQARQIVWEKELAFENLEGRAGEDPEKTAAYETRKEAIEEREGALRVLNNLLGVYYSYTVEKDFIAYDQALADVEEARVVYNRYLNHEDEIAAAQAKVQALKNTINSSKIIAPFNGTVTEIYTTPGEMVSSGSEALRLDNLENMVLDIYVSEIDIAKLEIGQIANIVFDALPNQPYKGQVVFISSAGTDDSGVVEFRVNVRIEDADQKVKPGFTAVVSIITKQVENALLVPSLAIMLRDGEPVVMVVQGDGTTSPVQVKTGAVSEAFTEIISDDLEEGDQLAVFISETNNLDGFMPGAPMPGAGMGQPRRNP